MLNNVVRKSIDVSANERQKRVNGGKTLDFEFDSAKIINLILCDLAKAVFQPLPVSQVFK